ncbi:uncharacterized protein LY89DRAFT_741552 [Mollisia scopiformis]|uniref:Uncharacterized protein n=1 Tax=Mollisia scopiformis TaxID=149040 RepID=A0A132B8H9_MOLSC|nr:uncharacterized protein LY89DRAFT_741552 [Mollisia scopiformis]KUJ08705.1 hypothetical protein LY89DRAFT_741552 [Mollisia scopiformis]
MAHLPHLPLSRDIKDFIVCREANIPKEDDLASFTAALKNVMIRQTMATLRNTSSIDDALALGERVEMMQIRWDDFHLSQMMLENKPCYSTRYIRNARFHTYRLILDNASQLSDRFGVDVEVTKAFFEAKAVHLREFLDNPEPYENMGGAHLRFIWNGRNSGIWSFLLRASA